MKAKRKSAKRVKCFPMEIGRLRAKYRRIEVEQKYYSYYTKQTVNGYPMLLYVLPFGGKGFSCWKWSLQNDKLWVEHCRGNSSAVAAIDYFSKQQIATERREKRTSEGVIARLASIFSNYPGASGVKISIPYALSAVGKWISSSGYFSECHYEYAMDGGIITILKTTEVHIQFSKEEHKLLLPPGTVTSINPASLLERLKENAKMIIFGNPETALEEQARIVLSLSETPNKLAQLLGLESAKLKNFAKSIDAKIRV